ncbi:hypothetical protein V502_00108 [Pseudogymnoascus sp. VKM F-4520 (FW-2644)]|nr:hypothetical protein V502_00108 [Pseudogymnoascus sp. VKM F-4520 (FW-2644)]
MALSQQECGCLNYSGITVEGSPGVTNAAPISTLDFNQNQDRPSTSDSNLQEELVPNYYTIDLSDAAVSLDNSDAVRERKFFLGGVQHETEESAAQTAATMEINLRAVYTLLTPTTERLNVLTSENSTHHETIQDLRLKLAYKTGQMDVLSADYNQLLTHNTVLNDKWRASDIENSELRKKNEALKTELYVYKGVTRSHRSKALSNDGNGGKRDRDVAESELHVNVTATGAAKKRSKFE